VRVATTLLALLTLTAVFADLLASDAPLVARHRGTWLVLPAVTAPARWARIDPSELETAVWAPVRASGLVRAAPGERALGGADVLARTIHGARGALGTTLAVLLLALALGVPLGALAGRSNLPDALLARAVELSSALPAVLLVAVLHAGWGAPRWIAFVLVVAALRAVSIARLVRGEVLRVSGTDFVLAAKALGVSPFRITTRHVLPHAWGPVLVSVAFSAAAVVALEAALSFLGLGAGESVPSWGALLGRGPGAGISFLLPALGTVVTTLCLYIVAEALDDRVSARRGGPSRV
jgi:ABC-type dipeptide/oligopeptide/nickel transport system permease subunit